MRVWTVTWMAAVACWIGLLAQRCGAQITLAWSPSHGPGLAGYNLCWGTNSGIYLYTNYCLYTLTNLTISNLAPNKVCFFVVQAVESNGMVSAFSNEADYTNGTPVFTNSPPVSTNAPPVSTNAPPVSTNAPPVSTNAPPVSTNVPPVSTNGSPVVIPGPFSPPATNAPPPQSNTNIPVVGGSTSSSTNITQATFWGMPPFLGMVVSNGQANLAINGTVGAMLTIMGTTNELSMNSWSAVTNVTMSNIASIATTNVPGQPQDLLDVAFVPGTLTLALGTPNTAHFQYFQVVMPYDYIILASQVLPGKGYTPRLIVVNMPGIVCDDACYVNETSSFIHYTHTNYVLQLISSSTSIRAIATSLANSLELDWTSASEFTYSNGMGQLLATVIETESPSSDPVAGQNPPGPPVVIDF